MGTRTKRKGGYWSNTGGSRFCATEEDRIKQRDEGYRRRPFSKRQQALLNNEIKPGKRNEVTKLIDKCRAKGMNDTADELYKRYYTFLTGRKNFEYNDDEIKNGLQKLTPWDIEWDD